MRTRTRQPSRSRRARAASRSCPTRSSRPRRPFRCVAPGIRSAKNGNDKMSRFADTRTGALRPPRGPRRREGRADDCAESARAAPRPAVPPGGQVCRHDLRRCAPPLHPPLPCSSAPIADAAPQAASPRRRPSCRGSPSRRTRACRPSSRKVWRRAQYARILSHSLMHARPDFEYSEAPVVVSGKLVTRCVRARGLRLLMSIARKLTPPTVPPPRDPAPLLRVLCTAVVQVSVPPLSSVSISLYAPRASAALRATPTSFFRDTPSRIALTGLAHRHRVPVRAHARRAPLRRAGARGGRGPDGLSRRHICVKRAGDTQDVQRECANPGEGGRGRRTLMYVERHYQRHVIVQSDSVHAS